MVDKLSDYEYITITLTDETEIEFSVLNIFEVNGNSYVSLIPKSIQDNCEPESEEIIFFGFSEDADLQQYKLFPIEDEEEYMIVVKAFQKTMEQYAEQQDRR